MTTLSTTPGPTDFQSNRTFTAVADVLRLLLRKLLPGSKPACRVDEAIEILCEDANPDLCDWAECYLCGMVDSDVQSYLARRRWQS